MQRFPLVLALALALACSTIDPADGGDEAGTTDTGTEETGETGDGDGDGVPDLPAEETETDGTDTGGDVCCECIPEGHDPATPWTCLVDGMALVCLPDEHEC